MKAGTLRSFTHEGCQLFMDLQSLRWIGQWAAWQRLLQYYSHLEKSAPVLYYFISGHRWSVEEDLQEPRGNFYMLVSQCFCRVWQHLGCSHIITSDQTSYFASWYRSSLGSVGLLLGLVSGGNLSHLCSFLELGMDFSGRVMARFEAFVERYFHRL